MSEFPFRQPFFFRQQQQQVGVHVVSLTTNLKRLFGFLLAFFSMSLLVALLYPGNFHLQRLNGDVLESLSDSNGFSFSNKNSRILLETETQEIRKDGNDDPNFNLKLKKLHEEFWLSINNNNNLNENTSYPTYVPTQFPTTITPSEIPTYLPTIFPSQSPTGVPTDIPTEAPTHIPTSSPSEVPTQFPSVSPTEAPTDAPTYSPTFHPTATPTSKPSNLPTNQPISQPSNQPTEQPTTYPSSQPSSKPSHQPTVQPIAHPTSQPSIQPPSQPSAQPICFPTSHPSSQPSGFPTAQPYAHPTTQPTCQPVSSPTCLPTSQPSVQPTDQPTTTQTAQPSALPSNQPSNTPTYSPTTQPTFQPIGSPTCFPTVQPSAQPTNQRTANPTTQPTTLPSRQPSDRPSCSPTTQPTDQPVCSPTCFPTVQPSAQPTNQRTASPTNQPTTLPSRQPSDRPSCSPTTQPTVQPVCSPTCFPTSQPSGLPTLQPTPNPTNQPTTLPSNQPSTKPTCSPTTQPSIQPSGSPTSEPSSFPTSAPTELLNCPLGEINVRSPGNIHCVACPRGYASPGGSSTQCTLCGSGTYAGKNSSGCLECSFNTYQPDSGSVSCIDCGPRYLTGSTGSTSFEECVNPSTSNIIGFLGLFFSIMVIWVYLYHGRLHIIGLSRHFRLIRKLTIVALATSRVQDLMSQVNSIIISIVTVKKGNRYLSEANQIILKRTIFSFLCALILFIVILSFIVHGILQILFDSMVIYRSFRYFIPLAREFRAEANYLVRQIGIGLGLQRLEILLYPFVYIIDAIASININFANVAVTCSGSQAPLYLLLNLTIVGFVVILIRSHAQVYWEVSLTQVLSKAMNAIFSQYYVSRNSISTSFMVMIAIILICMPPPRKLMQLSLSFVSVGYFFSENGRSPSNANCDDYGSGGIDTFLAVCSTLFVYVVISPVIYLSAQVLVPCFDLPSTTTKHGKSSKRNQSRNDSQVNSVDAPTFELKTLKAATVANGQVEEEIISSPAQSLDVEAASESVSQQQEAIPRQSAAAADNKTRASELHRDSSFVDRLSAVKTTYASPKVQTVLRYLVSFVGALFSLDWLFFKLIAFLVQRCFRLLRRFLILDHFALLKVPVHEDPYLQAIQHLLDDVKAQVEPVELPWTPWFLAWSDLKTTYRPEKQQMIADEIQEVKCLQEIEAQKYPNFMFVAVRVQLSLRRKVKRFFHFQRQKKIEEAREANHELVIIENRDSVFGLFRDTVIDGPDLSTVYAGRTESTNSTEPQDPIAASKKRKLVHWLNVFRLLEALCLRLCTPASYLIFFQILSTFGRQVWKRVWINYKHVAFLSVGCWTEEIVHDFNVLENYHEYNKMVDAIHHNLRVVPIVHQQSAKDEIVKYMNDPSVTSTKESAHMMGMTVEMLNHKVSIAEKDETANRTHIEGVKAAVGDLFTKGMEVHDAIIRVSNDKKFVFEHYVSAVASMRVILLQLIPFCTPWSMLAVKMSGNPWLVYSDKMKEEMTPLIVWNPFERARELWEDDYRALLGTDKEVKVPQWQIVFLGIYLFIRQSRAIQISLVLFQYIATLFLVFMGISDKTDDDDGSISSAYSKVISAISAQFILEGVAYSMYLILLLHKYMYPRKADAQHQVEVKEEDVMADTNRTSNQTSNVTSSEDENKIKNVRRPSSYTFATTTPTAKRNSAIFKRLSAPPLRQKQAPETINTSVANPLTVATPNLQNPIPPESNIEVIQSKPVLPENIVETVATSTDAPVSTPHEADGNNL